MPRILYRKFFRKTADKTKGDPPPHYIIPGMDLELIDILKSKSIQFSDPWEFFLWASSMQYMFRYMVKGEPQKDLGKAHTYLRWLMNHMGNVSDPYLG